MVSDFIHLRVHSTYSLLEGAIKSGQLVQWCRKKQMPAVAVTDKSNLFGALEFSLAAIKEGIQPILGTTLLLEPWDHNPRDPKIIPDQLLAYAQNETGWKNLLALVSEAYVNPSHPNCAPITSREQLEAHSEGLIILTGGIYGAIGKSLLNRNVEQATEQLQYYKSLYPDRLYVELSRHGMSEERQIESGLIDLAYEYDVPLVATNDVYFEKEETYEAHDAFLCIADGAYVNQEDRRRLTKHHRLKTPKEMCELFKDIPEAIENTHHIAKRCSHILEEAEPILPTFTQDGLSEEDSLRLQARDGLEERLQRVVYNEDMTEEEKSTVSEPYLERLEFELDVIINMKFPGYFLIVSDFIKWSKSQNIPVGPGRGSGAGSIVAWALQITDLDPLRFGLLFERFLNPHRVSMPDFDIDFCQERREEVIRYVQQKYGSDQVAQIITFGKLQARAVLRDVGRVLQMPYGQVDRICKLVPNNPAKPVTLAQAIDIEPMLKAATQEEEIVEKLIDISLKLEGLNRHASTHAAGVVIADRPLQQLVALYRDPKSDMPVVQYSMKYAEKAGLVKFDFLGLKTLTVISRTLKLLEPRNISIDLPTLPDGDEATYAMLGEGKTVGVFQLESAGMRDTLKKLRPDSLEDIIALVSLYRPGPMDNIPTYIKRKHGEEKVNYLHPKIKEVLEETFGVIIYQEQVMQIAQLLAGYSLGEADLLRRAMGKKIRAEMEAQREVFVRKAVEREIDRKDAQGIFDLIAKFAEYGFNKSHAAAYAVIAYQTGYLKANYPVEFFAASMTYDMHNTDKLAIFREDASRFEIDVLPPDVNASEVLFSVENGAVRYALAAVRNVGSQVMTALVQERVDNGPFKDIFDCMSRLPSDAINKRAMEYLVKAGAFDSLHANRKQLFEHLDMLLAHAAMLNKDRESNQASLFGGADAQEISNPILKEMTDWGSLERLEHEFQAIGFYLSSHPLSGYEDLISSMKLTSSIEFAEKLSGQYKSVRLAGIVTGTKFKVSQRGRFAFIQLSDIGGVYEVSIFDEIMLNNQRELLENGTILHVEADGKIDESGPRLIARKLTLFDDAIAKHKKRTGFGALHINICQVDVVPKIRSIIGEPNKVGAKIHLRARIDQKIAEIALPGKYVVSRELLDEIKAISGVESAQEIAA